MRTVDPMERVHQALEDAGCAPRGPVHKFSARCPAHEDRSPSLSVTEGADGRALLHCHAGCSARDIVGKVGLRMAELFPAGHVEGPRGTRTIRRGDPDEPAGIAPAAALLAAVTQIGGRWSGVVATECPACLHPHCWWRLGPDGVDVDCPDGCDRGTVLRALDCQVHIAKPEAVAA